MTFLNRCDTPCTTPVVRTLIGRLDTSAQPTDGSYLALSNIRTWILAQDLSAVPWNYVGTATFASDTATTPDPVSGTTNGIALANSGYFSASTNLPDSSLPTGDAIYSYARVQVLFLAPTDYLLVCLGNSVPSEKPGCSGDVYLYDEGCAGTAGGQCAEIMELPWSVIPGYPEVQIFLVGTSNGSTRFPDLNTAVSGFSEGGCAEGPDWNASQTCGGPVHANDPFGGQFEAP